MPLEVSTSDSCLQAQCTLLLSDQANLAGGKDSTSVMI